MAAWISPGQLGAGDAAVALVGMFDSIYDDDWALKELPRVMGMLDTSH